MGQGRTRAGLFFFLLSEDFGDF